MYVPFVKGAWNNRAAPASGALARGVCASAGVFGATSFWWSPFGAARGTIISGAIQTGTYIKDQLYISAGHVLMSELVKITISAL